jgi:hypothetical protein
MYTLEVLNPVAPVVGDLERTPLAPRPASLEGKTLGLVWNGKANGDVALKRVGEVLQRKVENLTVRFYSGSLPCDKALLERVKQECDVAVGCTAD